MCKNTAGQASSGTRDFDPLILRWTLSTPFPEYGDISRAWTGVPHVDLSSSRRVPVSPARGARDAPIESLVAGSSAGKTSNDAVPPHSLRGHHILRSLVGQASRLSFWTGKMPVPPVKVRGLGAYGRGRRPGRPSNDRQDARPTKALSTSPKLCHPALSIDHLQQPLAGSKDEGFY
jgi:hypothetical protein